MASSTSKDNTNAAGGEAPVEQETYKQQLDRVATERRNAEHPQQVHPVIEKSEFHCAALGVHCIKCLLC